jgi:asparagine synthase (glutamine-hydrolysing)
MCGIAGFASENFPQNGLDRMDRALCRMKQRGPNDQGANFFRELNYSLVLGHTRLSIIDLGLGGHQPMISADEGHIIVFNGEIYNYRELRIELRERAHIFNSESDTEVLLAAWKEWGPNALHRLCGMFAFALYDRRQKLLCIARDAFGIKPLFYAQSDTGFYFASEQQALLELRSQRAKPDLQRAYDYLVHGDYDSQERTFIEGVKHLPPGCLLRVDLANPIKARPESWWKPQMRSPSSLSFHEAADLVRNQFLRNVQLHLRSDVALGAALSGGIDSSAVVCAMRHLEPDAHIKTFSFIAKGFSFSEEQWIDRVNAETHSEGFKVELEAHNLLNDLDDMIIAQGEPFGSTSIYAQYAVFRLAKEHGITVMLDGQGADELLAGYSGYPGFRLLSLIESEGLISAHRFAQEWARWPGRSYRLAMMELGRIVLPESSYCLARKLLGRNFMPPWLDRSVLLGAGVAIRESRPFRDLNYSGRRVIEQLGTSLQARGLPALLRHADRNSMRFSVESRVPFLTTEFSDLLLSMPENYLISNQGQTKAVFRAAMRGIVPDAILDRKDKIGFATPEQEWIRVLAPMLKKWLEPAADIPMFNHLPLLGAFDRIINNKDPFSFQAWRWINYVRWHALVC